MDKSKTVPCGWKTNSPFMQILRKKYDVYGRLSLRLKTSDMWPLHTKITNTNLVCYSYNELMVEKNPTFGEY